MGRPADANDVDGGSSSAVTVPLLQTAAVAKTFGTVVALRAVDLAVAPGEVHALLGANGAGKSTLVKILTGVLRADAGAISIHGEPAALRSPGDARRRGLAPVFQDPAMVARSHRRREPPPHRRRRRRRAPAPRRDGPRRPRPRRAGPRRPAAVPAHARPGPGPDVRPAAAAPRRDHRGAATGPVRAGVRRDAPVARAQPLRAVHLPPPRRGARALRHVHRAARRPRRRLVRARRGRRSGDRRGDARRGGRRRPRRGAANGRRRRPSASTRCSRPAASGPVASSTTSASPSPPARCSASPPSRARARRPCSRSSPATASRTAASSSSTVARCAPDIPSTSSAAASCSCPPTACTPCCRNARSARTSPSRCSTASPSGARSVPPRSAPASTRRSAGCRSTPGRRARCAGSPGGNQQKVTIARWLAGGLRVMLLFDPTRGIDVGTKHQVYDLVRALADEGAAVLMFTSELREIALVCDRAAVLHGGRIVAELPADAGENALLTAAHGLVARGVHGERMTSSRAVRRRASPTSAGAVEPVLPVRPSPRLDGRRRRAARRARRCGASRRSPTSTASPSARSPPARCRWRSWRWPRA